MFFRKTDLKIKKSDFFLLPNILTYVRIILVPIFIIVYMNADAASDNIIAAILIIASGITDVLDGFIARHWNLTSDLGKILDPIADKAMQFSMMFCVCIKYRSVTLLIVIYAVKEVVSALASAYLFTRGKHISGAMWCGKVCTVILFLVMLTLVAVPYVRFGLVSIMVGFAAAFMLLSFFIYMRAYFLLWLEYLNEQRTPLSTDLTPLDKTPDQMNVLYTSPDPDQPEDAPDREDTSDK